MKKVLAFALSLVLVMGNFTAVFADSAADSLVKIIENTVKNPYIQISEDASLQYGAKNTINVSSKFEDTESAQKTTAKLKVDIDTSEFQTFADLASSGTGLTKDMLNAQININTGIETFYDKSNKDIFVTVLPFTSKITSTSADIKKILEGFLEFPKFVTNKTFHVNIDQIIQEAGKLDGADLQALLSSSITKEDVAALYTALIKSGILTVESSTGGSYKLGLISDLKNLNILVLKDALNELSFIPDDQKTLILDSIPDITKEDIKQVNEYLKMLNNLLDVSMIVNTNGINITSFQFDITVRGAKLLAIVPMPGVDAIGDILIKESGAFTYNVQTLTNDYDEAQTIHFNKIISAFQTIEKQSQAQMEEWSKNNPTPAEPAYTPMSEDEILGNLPHDAWYYGFAQHLAKKGALKGPIDPAAKITEKELYDLVSQSGAYPSYPAFPEALVSKESMIQYIVQNVNSEALYLVDTTPIEFAKKNGLVKEGFDEAQAKTSFASNAETLKVLSLALKLKDKSDRIQQLKNKNQ